MFFHFKRKVSNELNSICRSNYYLPIEYLTDRILRSHDATGGAAMKTINLQHNKPNNNNSHNFSHFEKKLHSISLFVNNQTIPFLNQSMTLPKKLSSRYSVSLAYLSRPAAG